MTLLIKDITEIEENICGTIYAGFLIEAENIRRTQGEKYCNKIYYICFVDNEQQCCEDFGYLSTPDDYKSFIGAQIYSYEVIDVNIDEQKLNIKTSKGDIQFSAYNNHNGYYYHKIIIQKFDYEKLIDKNFKCEFYKEIYDKILKRNNSNE